MKKIFSLLFIMSMSLVFVKANNVVLSNIALNGQNTANDFTLVNFNISWENSWRTNTNENNYDGAWIFVKFRKKNASVWQHATMNYVSPGTAAACGHTQPSGSQIRTASDGKGVWMNRASVGSGTNNWTGAKLRWNYGVDGVLDNDSVEVRVFALEMVYVTPGAFNLGSGGSEYYHFRDGAVDTYFPINSENAITCGNAAGNLWTSSNGTYWFNGTLPAAWPKGYNAFWVMKYEISQQQYVDFLNCIDYNKYLNRNPYSSSYTSGAHPNLSALNPERAIGYISGLDVLAMLDWAALRPLTELEFEKACRGGNQLPIADEYAWGNTSITPLSVPTNAGTATETWAIGNCNYSSSVNTQIRCGALATSTSDRTSSGATYYGIMEMSGNVHEWAITGYDTEGRSFTGTHGDGYLSPAGEANALNWPSNSGSGMGLHGGGFGNTAGYMCISDRSSASYNTIPKNSINIGGRGGRTAE
ncbi:MAG: SUMF1/EgtB/PvdO family nonheme iron enzyme [Chitinophagaceae bacterium]|nr:SUMF1/EgtB/PvdO family nonheme iron enzyme [Chitinophagaceae bacterium]